MISANKARKLTRKTQRKIAIIFKNKYSFSFDSIDESIEHAISEGKYETKIYIWHNIDKEDRDNLIAYCRKKRLSGNC